uniref:Chitotriosidase-1 n=1 Tax=Magallana gigas TaxID=29159 RepID=K1RC35_MAGGI
MVKTKSSSLCAKFPMSRLNLPSLLVFLVILKVSHSYMRVCYYTNWAQYRPNNGKYVPENLDPYLCSHLIFAFAKMNGNRLVAFEWNDESTDWMRGMYAKFNDIKLKNPTVKTLLAVGGWNMGSKPFTQMVKTPESRAEFTKSTIKFLRERNFDGLDLDWEYPANRGSPKEDKDRFTKLVIQLRSAFNQEAAMTGKPPLLLTAAVAAGKDKVDTGYDVATIAKHMDFINVMTYDLHGPWEKVTGHNSPLHSRREEMGPDTQLNIAWAAEYWYKLGLPKQKLNVGLALYGRSFTLSDPYNNGVGAPAKGKGNAGNYTREAGFLSYFEVCQKISEGAQKHYIPEQESPYITYADQWVGYDDADSLAVKVEYIKKQNYGGIMVWALDLDDFNLICNATTETYPLLRRINQQLGVVIPQTATVTRPPSGHSSGSNSGSHSTQNSNKPSGGKEFKCEVGGDGYYPSPYSCEEYYMCNDGHAHHFKCAAGLLFNSQFNYCGWPKDVVCDLDAARKKAKEALKKPESQQQIPQQPVQQNPPPVYKTPAENQNAFQFKPQKPQQPVQQTQQVQPQQVQQQPQTRRQPNTAPQPPQNNVRPPQQASQPNNAMGSAASNDPWNWSPFQQQQQNPVGLPFYWSFFRTDLSQDFCTGRANGLYPDPDNCQGFIDCVREISFKGLCSPGMAFDTARHMCDYIQNVPGCNDASPM